MAVVLSFASHLPHLRQRHDAWRERFTLGLIPDLLALCVFFCCLGLPIILPSFLLFAFRAPTEKYCFVLRA